MVSLIAGGAGFLGSHLVDALVAQGDDVIVADNLCTGSLRNLEHSLKGGRATFVYLDVSRPVSEYRDLIKRAARAKKIERVFHLAPLANLEASEKPVQENTSASAISMVDFAIEQSAQLIYASGPVPHDDFDSASEARSSVAEINRFVSRYPSDRGESPESALSAAVENGLEARIVRFFNCYGPRMLRSNGHLVATLADAILADLPLPIHGDGLQTHPMIFVDDAIKLMLMVASHPQTKLVPVDIASDNNATVLEIAAILSRVAAVPFNVEHLAPRPEECQRRRPDLTGVRSLGYAPRTKLKEGLGKTLAWLRESVVAYV